MMFNRNGKHEKDSPDEVTVDDIISAEERAELDELKSNIMEKSIRVRRRIVDECTKVMKNSNKPKKHK